MTKNDIHHRTYGYTEKDESKQKRVFSRSNKPKSTPSTGSSIERLGQTNKNNNKLFGIIKFVVFGIYKIFAWVLISLWGLVSFLWQKRPHLSRKNKRVLRQKLGVLIITGIAFSFLFITIMIAWASKDLPDPDQLTDRKVAQSTKIYDRTGEHVLYEVFADQKRTLVNLEDIPQHLIDGVIATEDTKFYEHHGIRPLSILRAVVYGVFSNKQIGGTSTLTQQLVKNAILTNERSYIRKLKEIILSIRLEQKYNKDQILKIYFNEIPYGSTNYGVESASQSYFGKPVKDLNLSETAVLAGLPKAPSSYLADLDKLKNRRDFVLERMFEEGYISREEADEAQNEPLEIKQKFENIQAPHFVLYVKKQLVEMYGEQVVDTGGLKVITSLDWEKQQAAEQAVEDNLEKLDEAEADNTALVALDPKTGQILALVGSRDFFDEEINGQFDVATLGKRQPGSSFKPIVYTAAFEKGYTPDTVLFDVETDFAVSGKPYKPLNYDLQEHGPVTMRQALQGSLNIPAVKTLYLVGEQAGVDFAERLGYTTLGANNFGLSLVLGGGEVKLIEHVSAFGVFANEGVRQEPLSILKIEDTTGDILYEWKPVKGEKVLEKEITDTISSILIDDEARAYAFGAGGILTLPDRKIAAKTGTTNAYVDAWTIGYTPSLVAGVWAGNTDNTPMKKGFGGSKVAAPIWNAFMREALKNTTPESFPDAPENTAKKPILRGSTGGGVTLKIDKVTGKLATSSTPEKYIEDRTYIPAHSILHYVTKDDPRGPTPENPTNDSQYEIWETAIQDWVTRKQAEDPNWKISFEEPPTEYDTEHLLELIPTLEIVYPMNSSTLYSRQIDTDIRASAPRGITKVTYRLDGRYVGVIKEHPFNLNYYADWLENGNHILMIVVEDDIGNLLESEVSFILEAGIEPSSVSWVGGNQTIKQSDFPRTFMLNHFKLDEITEVKIYKEKDSNKTLLETIVDFSNLFNNQIIFKWDDVPEKGEYKLIVEIAGGSDEVIVEIK
ncbi:MAG: PBP1A family penicillin-binding protein [Candidatus Magasanikbacteria bacterium]